MSDKIQSNIHTTPAEFLRIKDVLKFVPVSRSTVLRKSESGDFPKPIKLSAAITVWRTQDVRDWIAKTSQNQQA